MKVTGGNGVRMQRDYTQDSPRLADGARTGQRVIFGLLVFAFIAGLGLLAAFVPLGDGFEPKGGGWFTPEAAGGPFASHPLLIAALCVWTIVAAERPVARGLLIAAAALMKFVPALLAFEFLAVRRGRSRYALTLVAALAAMLAWPLITSGPARFLDSTFGYQLIMRGGGVQFSIWTYLPHVAIAARPILAAALVLLAISPMLRPGGQDARQQAALAAALLIGAQLLLGYWFYSYLIWFYPLLIVAVVRPPREHRVAPRIVGCAERAGPSARSRTNLHDRIQLTWAVRLACRAARHGGDAGGETSVREGRPQAGAAGRARALG